MIYIQGYSLVSARGKDVQSTLKNLNKAYTPKVLTSGIKFYAIKENTVLPYYDMIEKVTRDALIDAKVDKSDLTDMALFIGTSSAKLPLNEVNVKKEDLLLSDTYINEITQIIAKRIGIKGFRTLISTACTSSSNALIQAKEMIEAGLIQRAVIVGIELYNLFTIKGFESFMLLTQDTIKPFDKNRTGLILGEAVSAIVLSKEKSPFVFSGGSIHIDAGSITSPSAENLEYLMNDALQDANIFPTDIYAVKTHATGSQQNDFVEAKALHKIFSMKMPKIVTLKPYIGHTMGASGSSELALFLESLKDGFIPQNKQIETLDPECNILPLSEKTKAIPGYYMFNNFGFGGNNNSFIIQYTEL
ncbi:MAG: hypothetical protein L3J43_07290 [Sulfurovum sp.]|nr:hypothetical protein [Sulfurovum sp.]